MSNKLRICEKLDLLVRVNRHIISEIPDILDTSVVGLYLVMGKLLSAYQLTSPIFVQEEGI